MRRLKVQMTRMVRSSRAGRRGLPPTDTHHEDREGHEERTGFCGKKSLIIIEERNDMAEAITRRQR